MNFATRRRSLKLLVLLLVSPLVAAQCDVASLTISNSQVVSGTAWFSYGLVQLGSTKTQTFTISNSGSAPALLVAIGLAPQVVGAHAISGGSCQVGQTLAENGGSCTLAVTYTPTRAGHDQSILTVAYNWPDNGPAERALTLSLLGTGADAGARVSLATGPEYDFRTKAVGTSISATLNLVNTGSESAILGDLYSIVPFARTGGSCQSGSRLAGVRALSIEEAAAGSFPQVPAAESTCTLIVTFTPTLVGTASATLHLAYASLGSGVREPQPLAVLRGTGAQFWPVQDLALGGVHTCALLSSGDVRCWGQASYGKLGYEIPSRPCGPNCLIQDNVIGDNELPLTAGFVDLGGKAYQVSAGTEHTCALLHSGAVRCWGFGYLGRLGYGNQLNIGDYFYPAGMGDVNIGGRAVQVAAGVAHNCVLLDSGKVRCWGYNALGQLGYGHTQTLGDDELPVSAGDVMVGGDVIQVTAGAAHTCALLSNRKLRCWGVGGALGYGNATETIGDDELPASAGDVPIEGDISQVSAGENHTCALVSGKVRCWGDGRYGALGYGDTALLSSSGGNVDVGGDVAEIAAGANHTCALLTTRRVRCWGYNGFGQLGYGNTQPIGDDEVPARAGDVDVGGPVLRLVAGRGHTCAVLTNGNVRCWGAAKYFGQLGYGNENVIGDDETPATAGDVILQ